MIIIMLDFINTYVFGPGLCVSVLGVGFLFIVWLKGFFIVKPLKVVSAIKNSGKSGFSPIKAMIVALSGTLGVGNIVGIASAITTGGAGSVFWMLISTLAALPIKYAETVLAVRHSRCDKNGKFHGGAWFYLSDLNSRISKLLAVLFAILCLATSATMGCMVQANAIAVSLSDTFAIPPLALGLILTLLTLYAASGGIKRISKITGKLIPTMSAVYIAMSLFIIFTNLTMLDEVIKEIIHDTFSTQAVGGGIVGFVTCRAVRIGITRGIVSNEAGCGTAPIAHAGAEGTTPVVQGVFGMLEVFIDTVVICTLTALSVLIARRHGVTLVADGMTCVNAAYGRFIPLAGTILAAAIFVFAFCTIICWFFYGTESLSYLTKSKKAQTFYLISYSLFALFGAVCAEKTVWSLSDMTVSIMTAINICVLVLYRKEIKNETDIYFFPVKQRKAKTVK